VEIDPVSGTFSFFFQSPDRGASSICGPPWAILGKVGDSAVKSDPQLPAEALFNKIGFVRTRDEDAMRDAKRLDAVRRATGLVFHQFMLRAFDRAISAKRVLIYARVKSATAPLQQLPSDVWLILEVLDWGTGMAHDPQGVLYFSIHAASTKRPVSIAAQESAAIKALAVKLRNNPELTRAEAAAWCHAAGLRLTERGFQNRVWPRARAGAGLAERATPGRKRKSLR